MGVECFSFLFFILFFFIKNKTKENHFHFIVYHFGNVIFDYASNKLNWLFRDTEPHKKKKEEKNVNTKRIIQNES